MPALVEVLNSDRGHGAPASNEDVIDYLTFQEKRHQEIGSNPVLRRAVETLSTALRNPAAYDPASPVSSYERLKEIFLNNHGRVYVDDFRLAEELLVMYRTGIELLYQSHPVRLALDTTRPTERVVLPAAVESLLGAVQMQSLYPFTPQNPEEIQARRFVLARSVLRAFAKAHPQLIERFGYQPLRKLYESPGMAHNAKIAAKLGVFPVSILLEKVDRQLSGEELLLCWPVLVDILCDSRDEAWKFLDYVLPGIKSVWQADYPKALIGCAAMSSGMGRMMWFFMFMTFGKYYGLNRPEAGFIDDYWPEIVRLAREAKENAFPVLSFVMPNFLHTVTCAADFRERGEEVMEMYQLAGGSSPAVNHYFMHNGWLWGQFPTIWKDLLMPIIRAHKTMCMPILETVTSAANEDLLDSPEDFGLIKRIATQKGVAADDILENFLFAGVRDGVIPRPIHREEERLNEFLSLDCLYVPSVYAEFRQIKKRRMTSASRSKAIQTLQERSKRLRRGITNGTLKRAPQNKDYFGAALTKVFPQGMTVERSEYVRACRIFARHMARNCRWTRTATAI